MRILLLLAVCCISLPTAPESWGASAPTSQSSRKSGKKSKGSTSKSGRKSNSGSKKSGKGRKKPKGGKSNTPKTSAEARRRQQQAQQEVARTREELRRNEASIKKNLKELGKIDDDISVSDREVKTLRGNIGTLQKKITGLERKIADNNARLERMRAEYLKAVKKMRGSRKRNSDLAFIFSSKNLGEAERRMRYMKQFSKWKDRQTAEINAAVSSLRKQTEALARTQSDYNVMLGREEKAAKKLRQQRAQQDKIVTDLKANGQALQLHLQQKQAEVNSLRNTVASLIASEQAKAEAERRRREAAEAEARRREEAAEAERAARETEAAGQTAPASPEKETESPKQTRPAKETRPAKQPKPAKETKPSKPAQPKRNQSGDIKSRDYASARRRAPRGGDARKKSAASASSSASKAQGASGSDFASMKGSLPRPVSGPFRITSHFGRHALPELPDVMYDNPGIDAETASGAAVSAVYPGKVSGVYMIPGFSTVVIVNHGDYYTVYGNIASASVKVGSAVKTGDRLGALAPDPDDPGHSVLHFEVWKNREKLNPESWIR